MIGNSQGPPPPPPPTPTPPPPPPHNQPQKTKPPPTQRHPNPPPQAKSPAQNSEGQTIPAGIRRFPQTWRDRYPRRFTGFGSELSSVNQPSPTPPTPQPPPLQTPPHPGNWICSHHWQSPPVSDLRRTDAPPPPSFSPHPPPHTRPPPPPFPPTVNRTFLSSTSENECRESSQQQKEMRWLSSISFITSVGVPPPKSRKFLTRCI